MKVEPTKIQQAGLKVTLPRIHVLELLLSNPGEHFSAEDVYHKLRELKIEVNLATIYRVLTQFAEAGLVERHQFDNATGVFEISSKEHHDHMVCVVCKKIIEYVSPEIEELQEKVALEHGCAIVYHQHVLYVTCQACK